LPVIFGKAVGTSWSTCNQAQWQMLRTCDSKKAIRVHEQSHQIW
jgi:hypothetical protein